MRRPDEGVEVAVFEPKVVEPATLEPATLEPDLAVRPEELAPSAPYLARGEALFEVMRPFDMYMSVGRLLPHLDEACAALWGAERWADYLAWSRTAVLARRGPGSRRDAFLFDLAPHLPNRLFDKARQRLVVAPGADPRPRSLASGRDEAGPREWSLGVGPRSVDADDPPEFPSVGEEAAALVTAIGDDLVVPGLAAVAFGAEGPDGGSPAARLMRRLGRLVRGRDGLAAAPAGTALSSLHLAACDRGAEVPGAELLVSFVETAETLRAAARFYEVHVTACPDYYGIPDGHSQRMMTFAGAAMVTLALLIEMRTSGIGFATRLDGVPSFAPVSASGAFDAAWFKAAFARIKAFVPLGARYRAADLAEGFEHLRTFAYASVATLAEQLAVPGQASHRESAAELAFWRAGVIDPFGAATSVYGFKPLLIGHGVDVVAAIADEPLGIAELLRDKRRVGGLDARLGEVAAALRDEVTGRDDLPVFCLRLPDPTATTTPFERKVARERKAARAELAARRARGLDGLEPTPPRRPAPPLWPSLGEPDEAEFLQLVPLDECKPMLKKNYAAGAGFQLEDPPFVIEARLRRQLKKAADDDALAAARQALANEAEAIEDALLRPRRG